MRPSTLKKQKKIIETATKLFFEQGYSETSLDQIIEQCGGSKQTLYRYFGDKKGILVEVITHCTEEMEAAFQFDSTSEISLEEKLNQFGYEYLKALCSPELLNMYRIIVTESRHDKELAEYFLSRGPQHMHHLLVDYLQSQVEQGKLKIEDPKAACSQLLGALKGDYFHEALVGIDTPPEQEMKQHVTYAVKCFLHGYVA
ncbi:TetR/AcrR family transcriptional regulator [Photobacterium sp. SDRW27]|uniref:TetR/AcrR family transcriptional regulator n=1 Tax=Photobacterium obscurum TaxID=2829490 RepID=UPI002244E102|nr:TetR/AcrR family transcriptional regulator [Photobacterium obscurum]MCW8327617.1 TetR/AcrR family transcriptional regulator [Photobacterium obscurum]